MAAMVSAAHNGTGGDILVPPDGVVKLKDKTIPVIEQVRLVGGPGSSHSAGFIFGRVAYVIYHL